MNSNPSPVPSVSAPLVPLAPPVGVSGGSLPDDDNETTGATAMNGDEWTGDRDGEWWSYLAKDGSVYESREVPAYRIKMDNAKQELVNGVLSISPINASAPAAPAVSVPAVAAFQAHPAYLPLPTAPTLSARSFPFEVTTEDQAGGFWSYVDRVAAFIESDLPESVVKNAEWHGPAVKDFLRGGESIPEGWENATVIAYLSSGTESEIVNLGLVINSRSRTLRDGCLVPIWCMKTFMPGHPLLVLARLSAWAVSNGCALAVLDGETVVIPSRAALSLPTAPQGS